MSIYSISKRRLSSVFHLTKLSILLTFLLFITTAHTVDIKNNALIRDAEIEEALKMFTEPIFKVAGLNPKNLRIFVIANNEINAMATLNYTIFVHTGLISKAASPEEVIGVLAHETGHIACGHIARREENLKKSSIAALAAVALGAAATIAGSPDAGAGIMYGGMQVAQGNFLHYSRGQEASADQAALRFLKDLKWSATGLMGFMQVLAKQELLSSDRQDGYLRTHPFSSDRVQLMKNHVDTSPYTKSKLEQKYYETFTRLVAKVTAFMEPPMSTLIKYSANDKSLAARYARAIAYYRDKQLDRSMDLLDGLIRDYPKDAYFQELKGQIMFENGYMDESLDAYKKAVALDPGSALIRLSYVQTMMEISEDVPADTVIHELNTVLKTEYENPMAWHLLAIAFGKKDMVGHASLALAEKALCSDEFEMAITQGKRALHLLPDGPERLRAKDIVETALELKKNDKS
jgi:predicted Zn-dependent protease